MRDWGGNKKGEGGMGLLLDYLDFMTTTLSSMTAAA
jgi:hypothetical protein